MTWTFFDPLLANSPTLRALGIHAFAVNYSDYEAYGIDVSARWRVAEEVRGHLRYFRRFRSVAAEQVDVVGHSMGGLIARTLSTVRDFPDPTTNRGPVHKLISINTPHAGSPFANDLLQASPLCKGFLAFWGQPVGNNVKDLAEESAYLTDLKRPLRGVPTHVIASRASGFQDVAAMAVLWALRGIVDKVGGPAAPLIESGLCLDVGPDITYSIYFTGPSDLIVPVDSQLAFGHRYPGRPATPSTMFDGAIHTAAFLYPLGPDVLQRLGPPLRSSAGSGPNTAARVLQVLNQPVYGPQFDRILP